MAKPIVFEYIPKGPQVRASARQLKALNDIPGAMQRALQETDAACTYVSADVAWGLLHRYEADGQFTPTLPRQIVGAILP